MSPHINHPSIGLTADNPAVNLFTRRTFMKTSALTVGAVALLSQGRALATEGGESSSVAMEFRMACTNPSYYDKHLWTFTVLQRPTYVVRARVCYSSDCALYIGKESDGGTDLRDWNLVSWLSSVGAVLTLELESKTGNGNWIPYESSNPTKSEDYLLEVNTTNGLITRTATNSEIGMPNDQTGRIAKWNKVTRVHGGGNGATNSDYVTVVVEIAVKGRIAGEDIDLLFKPTGNFVNGQWVDQPMTFHSWVGHPKDATNTAWF